MKAVILWWIIGLSLKETEGFSRCRSGSDDEDEFEGSLFLECSETNIHIQSHFIGDSLSIDEFQVVCEGIKAIELMQMGDKIYKPNYERTIPLLKPKNCVLFGCYYDQLGNYYHLPTVSCSYKGSSLVDSEDDDYDYDQNVRNNATATDCQTLENVTHGEVDQDGKNALYWCQKGYRLKGIRLRICKQGSWVPDRPPVCVALSAEKVTSNIINLFLSISLLAQL